MRTKLIAAGTVLLLLGLITVGCNPKPEGPKTANPPPTDDSPPTDKGPKDKDPKTEPPPVVAVSAEDLFKEYKADRNATNKKYHGKLVEVSGPVDSAGSDNVHELPLVYLRATDKKGTLDWIECYFAATDEQPVNRLCKDQPVKIRGAIREDWIGLGVPLFNCTVVEQGPDPAIPISAVQLTKEYAADKEAADKKYDKKILIIDGVVAEVKPPDDEHKYYRILLEGFDEKAEQPLRVQANCQCAASKRLAALYATVKKGQTLKLKGGAYYIGFGDMKYVGVDDTKLLQ
jgi:hypothetical protein